ncbi:MAG: phosphomethylpyrimidine synthase ThiC, partial [Actinomycetota bacterium]|nr:phosphomethylpyrimidine synthase ThiC [Actinomycetota bacterium]
MEKEITLVEKLREGRVPGSLGEACGNEPLSVEEVVEEIIEGTAVFPLNSLRSLEKPCVIGKNLRTKVNANIGTSADCADLELEISKLKVAIEAGADTVMDLSTGGDIGLVREKVIEQSSVPVGTVPIYEAAIISQERYGSIVSMPADLMFEVIERHASGGVDFVTVHCGVTMHALECLEKSSRIADIVSRGGAFHAGWILHNEKENPLYEQFDRLLEIARRYELTLSLGDGLRPGAVGDATDVAQIQELITIGTLAGRAREAGVQVMVEGPGHVPIDQVIENVRIAKQITKNAPFYVLGPLVADIAPGYDHIVGGIGGALAASSGADFLCYVTPREHLGLPRVEDVRDGVIVTRIAAHAGDITKNSSFFMEWDNKMSGARKSLKWEDQIELSIDPEKARSFLDPAIKEDKGCSMCGDYCAMNFIASFLESE